MKNFFDYEVLPVTRLDCQEYILGIHYAKRWPSVSYRFGLFKNGVLRGVVTYGSPFSNTLKRGIAGEHFQGNVIELNRLCLRFNVKNEASFLIGKSLRMIEGNKIIVSFADTSQGHAGYVYQACNFIYCGLSAKRKDWKIKGKEHLHGQTISDEFRGVKNRVVAIREKYGDDFYSLDRPRKHRYIFLKGSKKFKKSVMENLNYKILDYPK